MPAPLRGLPSDLMTGDIQSVGSVHFVPLRAPSRREPQYRVLEDDLTDKVTITEVDESGSVPTLTVTNTLDIRIFIMDGQELVGAKQNRMVNADIMVPANTSLNVPVSCVERGRWRYVSRNFSPSGTVSHRIRSRKSPRVHQALRASARHDAGQGEVWDDVDETLRATRAASASAAIRDAFQTHERTLERARNAIELPDDTIGIAVFLEDRWLGTDLFDRHATLKHFWTSLVDSYLLDHLAATGLDRAPEDDHATSTGTGARPTAFDVLNAIHAASEESWDAFESPGEGTDMRLSDERWNGAALQWTSETLPDRSDMPTATSDRDDVDTDLDPDAPCVIVHLQLFPGQSAEQNADADRGASSRLGRINARLRRSVMDALAQQAEESRSSAPSPADMVEEPDPS